MPRILLRISGVEWKNTIEHTSVLTNNGADFLEFKEKYNKEALGESTNKWDDFLHSVRFIETLKIRSKVIINNILLTFLLSTY